MTHCARQVRHYQYLSEPMRARLEEFIQILLAEKDWVGGSGFQLSDTIKVTVAGYAGVMTLGLEEPYYFDRLMTIIIYPGGATCRIPVLNRGCRWAPAIHASAKPGSTARSCFPGPKSSATKNAGRETTS